MFPKVLLLRQGVPLLEIFEKGKVSEKKFWQDFLAGLNIFYRNTRRLHNIVIDQFKPIEETIKITKKSRKKFTVGLLSNQTDWIDELEEKYHFRKMFDFVIISKEVKCRKPEKEIFDILIKKSKVKPNRILFIDDMKEYQEVVGSLGINFIYYQNLEKLKSDLRKFKIFYE